LVLQDSYGVGGIAAAFVVFKKVADSVDKAEIGLVVETCCARRERLLSLFNHRLDLLPNDVLLMLREF